MTPLQIEILIHYSCGGTDYQNGEFSPAATGEIELFKDELILVDQSCARPKYKLSERGRFFVDYILSLELPTVTYKMQKAVTPPPAGK